MITEYVQADVSKLGECEFWLISEMNAQLIIHHPYRELSEMRAQLKLTPDEFSLAWSVVNDHYMTVLPLMHPPVTIAAAAVTMVLVVRPSQAGIQARASISGHSQGTKDSIMAKHQALVNWLTESGLNMEPVAECTQEFLSLYAVLERYSERTCKEQVGKLVAAETSKKHS